MANDLSDRLRGSDPRFLERINGERSFANSEITHFVDYEIISLPPDFHARARSVTERIGLGSGYQESMPCLPASYRMLHSRLSLFESSVL